MIDLSRRYDDSINDGELSDDQLRALAADRLAWLIAENVCGVLSTFTDEALATALGNVGEGKSATASGTLAAFGAK